MIRVRVISAREVSVHTEPSWLARFLGAEAQDRHAVAVPAVGGGVMWCFDATGRHIENRRVIDAIEREQARGAARHDESESRVKQAIWFLPKLVATLGALVIVVVAYPFLAMLGRGGAR